MLHDPQGAFHEALHSFHVQISVRQEPVKCYADSWMNFQSFINLSKLQSHFNLAS